MRIVTTGHLLKMFTDGDKDTILRKRTLRKFIKDNVKYHYYCTNIAVDFEDFMNKVNPKGINQRYPIPKIRTMTSAVREFNKTHFEQINIHIIERCLQSNNKIPHIRSDRLILINYDILEKEILLQLKKKKKVR